MRRPCRLRLRRKLRAGSATPLLATSVAGGAVWAGEEESDFPSSLLGGDAGLVAIINALRRKNELTAVD
eukprot:3536665-Pyramimonas_sp.AAC.1